jgi:hypothetical protein
MADDQDRQPGGRIIGADDGPVFVAFRAGIDLFEIGTEERCSPATGTPPAQSAAEGGPQVSLFGVIHIWFPVQ